MKHKKKTGIIVMSGPSGAGKTTLLKKLFRKASVRRHYIQSVSCTTRSRRPKEKEGKDYCFISREEFQKRREKNFFLEWEKVVGEYYGTPRGSLTRARREGKNLVVCIDVKGGMRLKKSIHSVPVATIFITAPRRSDLHRRLKKREEKEDMIKKRVLLAKKELQFIKDYDYVIINQNLTEAIHSLESILTAERLRRN